MIVRATTDYSIRIMVFLATTEVASSALIAKQMGIPHKYLIKIAAALRNKDLISSLQGANGGYTLARPAEKISMCDIILAIEPELLTVSEDSEPSDGSNYRVQQMFQKINGMLVDYFKSISLADFSASCST